VEIFRWRRGENSISATGKPVNPAGFPASAMLFSGNASNFGFNRGTGGAFVTTAS